MDAVDVKADSIKLAWRPPADDGGAKIDKYVLEKRPKGMLYANSFLCFNFPIVEL